jgi:protein-disulfide isomerase/LysM repeat protein
MKTPARVSCAMLSLAFVFLILTGIPHITPSFAQVSANATPSLGPGTSGGPVVAEIIFTAPSPVVALAVGGDGLLYLLTYDGEILKVSPDGTSTSLATGVSSCSFSSYALVALPDGSVIANSCVDKEDILIKIDPAGNQSTLVQLGSNVLSMTSDASGNLYLGTWSSEGDLTVMFDPSTYLAGAVNIWGQISLVDSAGVLTTIFEGGAPLALHVSQTGDLYAAVWGKSGGFSAESKSYSVCDLRNFFWIALSEQVQIQRISNGQALPVTDQLYAVGSLVLRNNLLLAYGFPPDQACGIYRTGQGQPQRLLFTEEGVDESITGMVISGNTLYFSNVDGNVFKVNLEDLSVGAEPDDAATATAPVPSATATPLPTQTPNPTPQGVIQYVVQPGDTLAGIALSHGATVEQILEMNAISASDMLYVGQVLNVPAGTLPDTTPTNESAGQIVFVSDRDGNQEIYIMDASGDHVRRLTDNPAADSMPAWSLDGTRIVFQSQRDGNWEIYMMNADGSGVQRVTDDPADDTEPLWLSVDTTEFLLFRSNRGGSNSLYTMSLDGSSIQPVTGNDFLMADVTSKVLRFAYVQDDLWTFALDDPSSLAHRLTFQGGVSYPAWSPDGKQIAFGLELNGDSGIYVIDYVDYGSGEGHLRELTPDTARDTMPTWSPDGRQIAFVSERNGNPEIYVMNSDGGPAHQLTDNAANDLYPDWGPGETTVVVVPIPFPSPAPQATWTATPMPLAPTVIPRGVAEGNAPFRGAADAPVVIVEFADFQCPYCGRWYAQTLPRILETYPNQVKFVYRHFPIFGDDSVRAAMAADCANDQGKFWEMHDRLFTRLENQEQASLSEDTLVSYAQELGLDTRSFGACLSSQKYLNNVISDYQTAQSYGLQGTPGFVIDGVVYPIGAQPFEVFDSIIKAELSRAGGGS